MITNYIIIILVAATVVASGCLVGPAAQSAYETFKPEGTVCMGPSKLPYRSASYSGTPPELTITLFNATGQRITDMTADCTDFAPSCIAEPSSKTIQVGEEFSITTSGSGISGTYSGKDIIITYTLMDGSVKTETATCTYAG